MAHVADHLVAGAPHAASLLSFSWLHGGGGGEDHGHSGMEFREYYSAACPHCIAMDGAWKKAAGRYKGPIEFRQVECADEHWQTVPENAKLCKGIEGFPTVKLFNDGQEVAEYSGNRSPDSLVEFAKQHERVQVQAAPVALGLFLPPPLRPRRDCPSGSAAGRSFL
mmetsp:Transcript_79188/g.224174  ORF Transcript_79188/g.224174 Transcript_79188/m.224174 type:complete len:166 (+) Transcript_79188:76-573(+)